MTLKERAILYFFGNKISEAWFADSYLSAFYDGKPHTNIPVPTGDTGWTESRIKLLLLDNNFLKTFANGYVITSTGRMHLDKGGYIGEFIRHKLSRLSFWLSIVATIISVVSIIISLSR